jgi:hypothetical protein
VCEQGWLAGPGTGHLPVSACSGLRPLPGGSVVGDGGGLKATLEDVVRVVGGFLAVAGVAIGVLWVLLLATGQVPEIEAGQADIWFHVVAELAAAVLLVTAGVAVLQDRRRGRLLAAMAIGALGYTTINSAGYYAEAGDWAPVGLFGLLLVLTVLAGVRLARPEVTATAAGPRRHANVAGGRQRGSAASGPSRGGARDER